MQNIDTFNELVGWILGKAYETHPERLTLDPSDMPPWLRKKVSRGPEDFWDRTVLWLEFLLVQRSSVRHFFEKSSLLRRD